MKRFYFALFLMSFFISCGKSSDGASKKVMSFLPTDLERKNLRIKSYQSSGGLSESEFDALINEIDRIYQPIFKRNGIELVFDRKYDDNTINAYANFETGIATITLFGGLAKHPVMTSDSYALVILHEIGHVLSGRVRYPNSWGGSEGNSDNYATQVGARKIFGSSSSECECGFSVLTYKRENSMCSKFRTSEDKLICERSLKGSLELAQVLADLNDEQAPTYQTMDRSKARRTIYKHPRAACRLAQSYDGTMSTKVWNDNLIPLTLEQQFKYSAVDKSNCWYDGK